MGEHRECGDRESALLRLAYIIILGLGKTRYSFKITNRPRRFGSVGCSTVQCSGRSWF